MRTLRQLVAPNALWVILLAIAGPASAQITTGTISGIIKDAQGGVIPGATVVATEESRGTKATPAVTDGNGSFTIPNLSAGTYTLEITMASFKTSRRQGVTLSGGDRLALPAITIEVGGAAETVTVKAETPLVQAQSGERSFTITTESVENLPIASRSFTALASLAPGVGGSTTQPIRTGDRSSTGGGNANIMMDGVSTMDTGSNSVLLQMNVESIAEVKVLSSNYQAEYGRSSGVQVSAVTKSGTNRFRGSVYDVERDSDWNNNSRVNILNGDPKTVSKQRDWGYSIGGPIGKPGASNKLFFFYSQEFEPRTGGNDVVRYRMPTALERSGDFSKTTDNNGAAFPYIKDPLVSGACSAADQTACFKDGGVVGRIPANRLYQTGLNILNQFPLPNIDNVPTGQSYNYELQRPTESALAWQPAIRLDYQPMQKLRVSFKYAGWAQRNQIFNGTIPGYNDSKQQNPKVTTIATTVNYSLTPTMFLEATYGTSQNELAGCALAQGSTGPVFCQSALPMNASANRNNAGLGALPLLFPDALVLNPSYYAYAQLEKVQPPIWENGQVLKVPNFTWAGRVANSPPNTPFPGYFNINSTKDFAVSLTKVMGSHTLKSGFYNSHSYKAQQQGNPFGTLTFTNDTSNPLDSQYPFANALLGIFSSYQQQSAYIEGNYVYNNTEFYVQDNWKFSGKLTFDYGVRFVHQQPQYDELGQGSNFFVNEWTSAQAPALYLAGCANGAVSCSGTTRQAYNPATGQFLGPNSTSAIATLVPNTGNRTNGLHRSGDGIAETTYTWPALGAAPRFGMAYDLTGSQKFVLRGGAGLFYDRPSGNSVYPQITNPPSVRNVTVRYGQLQQLANAQFQTEGAPALSVFEYDAKLPSSTQWDAGVQMTMPFATVLDVSYVGQHGFNIVEGVNINAVDFGSAFLAKNQDPTLGTSATPGAAANSTDLMRAYRGYAGITYNVGRGWVTYHSLQVSLNRRFRNGFQFGFYDTMGLSQVGSVGARLQHNADGTYGYRADQADADNLFQTDPVRHTMRGTFVWDLPDLHASSGVARAVGVIVNDWQLSGIWSGQTGAPYTASFTYTNGGSSVNLTGSPDYAARIRLVGDPGSGCSSDVYSQFNVAAFQGPLYNSVGLESGSNYMKSCFSSALDLAIARNVRLPKGRNIQFRVDIFNAPNSALVSGRNAALSLASPNDPVTAQNLPYDASGNLIATRSQPKNAGFGVANNYQGPRNIQLQVRFSF